MKHLAKLRFATALLVVVLPMSSFAQEHELKARLNDLKSCVDSYLVTVKSRKDFEAKDLIASCRSEYDAMAEKLPPRAAPKIKQFIKEDIKRQLELKRSQ